MPKCGRRTDVPPFESQIGEIMTQEYVNRNAPFGTNYTPMVRTKIIGGVPRQVKETQRSFRHPALEPIMQKTTQKSTHDDGVQTDFDILAKRKQGQQLTSSSDWKSSKILPPIQSDSSLQLTQKSINSQRNVETVSHGYKQTHSESAPPAIQSHVPSRKKTDHAHNTNHYSVSQHDQQLVPQISLNFQQSPPIKDAEIGYQPKDYADHGTPREHQWKPAAGYSYLPTQPIALSKDQELFLMHKLSADIAGCSVDQVKAVYEEMAANDHHLTGIGSYSDLGIALQKHGVYPNLNTLRLLASTCVSSVNIGYVDYERLLSFLIAAVRKGKDHPKQSPAAFYSPRNGHQDPFSTPHDPARSEGHLYRIIQQQLLQANATVNIEELRKMFGKADRSFRLTLSQPQIKEICRRMSLPISDAVVDMMLQHCETHGDGQYVWTDFVEILEKVQPHATGLPIPQSKRPLEYAKMYRQPNENWPHPNPVLEPLPSMPQKYQNTTEKITPLSDDVTDPPAARALQHQHISAPAGVHDRSLTDSQISPRGLGVQHNSKPWSKEVRDPWFTGFRKMAEALYRNDLNRKGSMKPDQCRWLITEYSEIYDLQIDPEMIDHCIHRNTTTSGTEIDGLLQSLLSLKQ